MHVLITGSSGKLGRSAVFELARAGHTITAVDRAPADPELTANWPDQRVRRHRADAADLDRMLGLMKGVDAVIHLAAISAPRLAPDNVLFANNVQSTFSTLEAAARSGVHRVVLASSAS